MFLIPKLGKRPKRKPEPIARSPIKKRKGSFKACDNGKRKPRRDPAQTEVWALQIQAEKRSKLSTYQIAVGETLREYGIKFEYEAYWPNGDYPIFSDIYIPSRKLTLEIDGRHHEDQSRADKDRALYLARTYSVATARFTNAEVKSGKYLERLLPMLGLTITAM